MPELQPCIGMCPEAQRERERETERERERGVGSDIGICRISGLGL